MNFYFNRRGREVFAKRGILLYIVEIPDLIFYTPYY
jgi:hypothetical protein